MLLVKQSILEKDWSDPDPSQFIMKLDCVRVTIIALAIAALNLLVLRLLNNRSTLLRHPKNKDFTRCADKFLNLPPEYKKCDHHGEIPLGCGTSPYPWYLNYDQLELGECCRLRLGLHLAFLQCILLPHNIHAWPDHGTLLGVLRETDVPRWDSDADLGVLVKAPKAGVPKLPSYQEWEHPHRDSPVNISLPTKTIAEVCKMLDAQELQERYLKPIKPYGADPVLGCGIVSHVFPSLRVDLIAYTITKEGEMIDVGYPHVRTSQLSSLFPLRPTCRMSGVPLMCPRDAVHFFQGIGFYRNLFGAKKYASGAYREKYKPMWKNMLSSSGIFLTCHAVRSKLQSLHRSKCMKQSRRSVDCLPWSGTAGVKDAIPNYNQKKYERWEQEFWTNDGKYWSSQWNDTGNYQLFPRSSLSLEWPDVDTL